MKLTYCLKCGDIFSPGVKTPKSCGCGYALAKWTDPRRGLLDVASRLGINFIRVLGVNNLWLDMANAILMSPEAGDDEIHKSINERTSEAAEGYLFKTRNCPIIMVKPGRGDITYNEELIKEVPWGDNQS